MIFIDAGFCQLINDNTQGWFSLQEGSVPWVVYMYGGRSLVPAPATGMIAFIEKQLVCFYQAVKIGKIIRTPIFE